MWYRLAQQALGVGGGIMRSPAAPLTVPEEQASEAQAWDALVKKTNHINNQDYQNAVAVTPNEGPVTHGTDMRRLSPYHNNPEHTTLEVQLETARQQNINREPQSMSQQNIGTGSMLVRGLPQYGSGKSWVGFQSNSPATRTLV